jgi:C1A family cysteine protease
LLLLPTLDQWYQKKKESQKNFILINSSSLFFSLHQGIAVDASSWKNYETGVYDGCNQTNPDLDHNVQLVGYGTDEVYGDYWLVRNSWTTLWGENGYVRLKRSSNGEETSHKLNFFLSW